MIAAAPSLDDWAVWKRQNAKKLQHPAGFEEKFVDLVLSRIPGLAPSEVVPQFGFVDNRGRSRRIDFVIVNRDKGYLLPIELDGDRKDALGCEWSDFLERQNSLLASFGIVLRYSNAKMFNNPDAIIREISEHLALQQAARFKDERTRRVLSDFIASAEKQLRPGSARSAFHRWPVVGGSALALMAAAAAAYVAFGSGLTRSQKEHITASEAAAHIGKHKRICGVVSGIREMPTGRLINFDRRYPNQTLTAVVWKDDLQSVGDLEASFGDPLCVEGTIAEFGGKPSVRISNRDQISR